MLLMLALRQLHEFQENNKLASPGKSKYQGSKEKGNLDFTHDFIVTFIALL